MRRTYRTHEVDKKCIQNLVRKSQSKKPAVGYRCKWKNKQIFKKRSMRLWTGLRYISIDYNGGLLSTLP
jgi:hypothetical protein